MGKYRLDTSKTTTFTVVIEAESIEDAEKQVEQWIDIDFEPFADDETVWNDGLWIDVTEEDN